MMTSFGVSLDKIQWVLTGYVVARTVLMPTVGWLGGWIGQRNLYLLSLVSVVGSSVLGGAAWNLESLIIFRVLRASAPARCRPSAWSSSSSSSRRTSVGSL
jgi:MFS family permease